MDFRFLMVTGWTLHRYHQSVDKYFSTQYPLATIT